MDIRLPYSPSKRYLTGVDWVIAALCRMTERATGAGNQSVVVLDLEMPVAGIGSGVLRESLARYVRACPAAFGRLARDWNLAPYWRMRKEWAARGEVRFTSSDLPGDAGGEAVVAEFGGAVSAPLPSGGARVAFHFVRAGAGRALLGMVFDHRLFDARGAELFLAGFQRSWQEGGDLRCGRAEFPSEPARLSGWAEKFEAGRAVNRAMWKHAGANFGALPLPEGGCGPGYDFCRVELSADATARLEADANRLAGYLMRMPYALALSARAVDRVFAGRGLCPETYSAAVSIDRRAKDAPPDHDLFNRFSFLHFLADRRQLGDIGAVASGFAGQMFDQMHEGLPDAFERAMLPMRIFPAAMLGLFSSKLFGDKMGTFVFSYMGESAYVAPEFFGCRVVGGFHLPRVPVPPGLGVFWGKLAGRMNVVVSAARGLLRPGEAGLIAGALREDLGA